MKTIEIQSKHNQNATLKPNTCERIKTHLIYLPNFVVQLCCSTNATDSFPSADNRQTNVASSSLTTHATT